jgi:hypothetical protein
MKNVLRLAMVLLLAASVAACGGDDENNGNNGGNNGADAGDVQTDGDQDAGDVQDDGDTQADQSIIASDQTVDPIDEVVVDEVISDGPGWVVIHEDDDGSPGAVIGNAAVSDGTSTDVSVTLDRDAEDGETLYAMLHDDSPEDGEYSFDPSASEPEDPPALDADGEVVVDPFTVTLPGANEPSVTAEDQTVDPADEVVVAEVVANDAGWIVIHEQDGDGNVGDVIGHEAVTNGTNSDVAVTLDRDIVDGETLYAMLHIDDPADGEYRFDGTASDPEDPPVVSNGETVLDPFTVTTPSSEPTVTATDQTLDLSTMVTVDSANLLEDGFIVIHEQDTAGSAPGAVIGHAPVSAGNVTDVTVGLERPAEDGETLYAMLHEDTGTIGEYEFDGSTGSADPPVRDSNDDIVVVPFEVTVPADTPAVRFLVGNNGASSYDINGAEPALYEDWIGSESNNQTLTLTEGWRYEIRNNATVGAHPFELIDSTSTTDTILASQSSTEEGTFEADPDVNWTQNGDDATFTLTSGLAAELNGYRCGIHTSSMRGDVTTQTP